MESLAERLKNMTPLQRAVLALKETQARLDALERRRTEPIAIVGMACRFPGGAGDAASFWRLLCDGVDAVGDIPPDRWNADEYYDPDPAAPGKMCTRWGGFLDRIDEFDNNFFGISEREATRIDPQQRILLELAWEALEDAGLPPCSLRGSRTGVFVGISVSEYGLLLSNDPTQTDAHVAAGTSLCLAANRLSFALGLQGPSMALDTACSSSLVAADLACQHIRDGQCETALVAGANLILSPTGTINLTKAGFCATDGRVRAFDAKASGYVRSEGAGLVVLKPLSAALHDNDSIYAVIRGSAVNQNGASNGLTAPSRAAQEQVLREAYSRADVPPGQVQFVETQGTGTRLGDAIEATALASVLREGRAPGSRCVIGALKTNLGHTEATSGMASLMKTALALKHRQLPPNLHFETPNPDIPLDSLPLRTPQKLEPWPDEDHPRWAGVSAFGFGGSNAHMVLEEAPSSTPLPKGEETVQLLPLSARTEKALHDLARRYTDFLRNTEAPWSDVCYTAGARREHHDCRLAVLADSCRQAADLLAETPVTTQFTGRKPFGRTLKVAFLFDDEAESWKRSARCLIERLPNIADCASQLDATLQAAVGWPLNRVLDDAFPWDDPTMARPGVLALQLTMTVWWRALGIAPNIVLGRGVGELAAAYTAGILTAEEAFHAILRDGDGVQPRSAGLPFLSSVDGKPHAGPDLTAGHWSACLRHADGFDAAFAALAERQVDITLDPAGQAEKPVLRVLTSLGTLYAAGADVVWRRLAPADARLTRVPTYPWQRQRLWALRKQRPTAPASVAAESADIEPIRSRSDLRVPYVAPRTALETTLAESWSAILRIDRVGVHDNFLELGGDSLQATILLNRLQEQLGESVPGHMLFHAQTIDDLAGYLRQHHGEAVRRSCPDEPVGDDHASGAAIGSIPRLVRAQQEEELLARLDDLTDEEVAALLGEEATDE